MPTTEDSSGPRYDEPTLPPQEASPSVPAVEEESRAQAEAAAADRVPTQPGVPAPEEPDGTETTWFRTPPPPNLTGQPLASWPAGASSVPVANIGEVLGNYRLEQVIGEGAMGVVFVGRHVKLDRQVAVKILKPQHSADSSLVQRFFQEARAVNAINHENIVEIVDFVEEPAPPGAIPRYYCVLELLSGTNLRTLTVGEPLSVRRAVHITRQLCAALGAAHRAGIIHRDLKPDNVFITSRGGDPDFVKVLDFGVAKLTGTRLASSPETFAGAVIGTPGYMAPEQASGLEVDGRADLYAAGTVLYELLAGRRPFRATELGQWAVELIVTPPPPLPEKTPGGEPIPPGLAAVVMRCLEKAPEARFATMEELSEALRPYAQVPIPLTVPAPTPLPQLPAAPLPSPAVSRARPRWPWAAAGLALLALGTAVWKRAETGTEVPPAVPAVVTAPVAAPAAAAPEPAAAPPPAQVLLQVRSKPEGAKVFRSDTGEALGVTPLELSLSEPRALRFELKGYQPAEATARPDEGGAVEVTLRPRKAQPSGAKPPGEPKSGSRLTNPDGLLNPFRK